MDLTCVALIHTNPLLYVTLCSTNKEEIPPWWGSTESDKNGRNAVLGATRQERYRAVREYPKEGYKEGEEI